jgi:hypothetical protein
VSENTEPGAGLSDAARLEAGWAVWAGDAEAARLRFRLADWQLSGEDHLHCRRPRFGAAGRSLRWVHGHSGGQVPHDHDLSDRAVIRFEPSVPALEQVTVTWQLLVRALDAVYADSAPRELAARLWARLREMS